MNIPSDTYAAMETQRTFPARIGERTHRDGSVEVLPTAGSAPEWARVALEGGMPAIGSEVLVTGQGNEFFVIGLLRGGNGVRTRRGAQATAEGDTIHVRSAEGALLFEYDAETRGCRVHAPDGDIAFVARRGAVRFHAAREVLMDGDVVEIRGRRGVALRVGRLLKRAATSILLRGERLSIHSRRVEMDATTTELELGRTRLHATSVDTEMEEATFRADRVTAEFGTVKTMAKEFFRTIEGLSQTIAGRVRTVVRGAWQLRSGRTLIKSKQDVRIDGKRIHLG